MDAGDEFVSKTAFVLVCVFSAALVALSIWELVKLLG